jgi:hypothetical protein
MAKRKPSARAERRAQDRAAEKFTRDLDRIARLEPGATPERPIALDSASQVEIAARSIPCPRCRGEVRVEDHAAEVVGGARLRIARVACAACGARRALYFRLGEASFN